MFRSADWRGYLLKLRWQGVQALTPRWTVRSRGLVFALRGVNWTVHYRWRTYNAKEPFTLDWIDRHLRDGDVFFDIGANIGLYALYAALRHPRVRVMAFEPEYGNLHLLRDNVADNRLQERIEISGVALSDRCGVSRLHVQDLTPGSALHTESPERLVMTRTGHPVVWSEGVYAMTLDQWCLETGVRPNAIKIDVDGTEDRVLEGAAQTLAWPGLRSLIIERPDDRQARERCAATLREAGFMPEDGMGRPDVPNEVWRRGPC
jgi:FkbM family methyltransferase